MICSTRELLCGLRDISCRALVLATKISHPGISISSQETLINPPPRKLSETIFVHDHVTNHFLPPIFFRRPDLFCWGGLKILWPIRNLVVDGCFCFFVMENGMLIVQLVESSRFFVSFRVVSYATSSRLWLTKNPWLKFWRSASLPFWKFRKSPKRTENVEK